jgi:hypothetical protein
VADQHLDVESQEESVSTSANGGGTEPKPTFADQIKGMSFGALIGSAVAILVVGLVIGLAAGYKIEQTRTKNDVNRLKEANKATGSKPSKNAPPPTATTSVRLAGTVGTATNGTVTLSGGTSPQTFQTDTTTAVVRATPGSASDITAGQRVVWQGKSGQLTQAAEVIVLPADAKIGSVVVSATPTSMQITSSNGNLTINTSGATVDKVTTAALTDVTPGNKIVAQARLAGSTDTAIEIILLPSSSKFAA